MRLACLVAPELPLQAWRRGEPDLAAAPVAVVASAAPSARLIACSAEGRALGVRVGMTRAQARALSPRLLIRPLDPVRTEAARAALLDAAFALGARVEGAGAEAYVEVGDLGQLYPDERAVGRALLQLARGLGLEARVGIAGSKGVARLAALASSPETAITVVPVGEERLFVAGLPVELLDPSPEGLATLHRFGVRTAGRLAALPAPELALRLGAEGERLAALARGQDDSPLCPLLPADEVEEGMSLDYALDNLEALGFVLRGLCDRLLARLAARHLACAGLGLRLHLEPRGFDVREVTLLAPTRDGATLLELLRLDVARRPPSAPVTGVTLLGRAAFRPPAQLDLFRPRGPAPDRLATTVAKLQALVGEGQVGCPGPVDSYRDEELVVRPFALPTSHRPTASPPAPSPPPTGEGHLALRRFRPPREVEVLLDGGAVPRAIRGAAIATQVVVAAGPYRQSGQWWNHGGFARDHWDVHASDGAIYRLFRDVQGRWFVEGYYD